MNSRVSAILITLAGCSGNLDPPSLVNKLRVLAVRAQVPNPEPSAPQFSDAHPGDRVTLDALVAGLEGDVDGGVTADMVDYLWFACTPPPGSTSVRDCTGLAAGMVGFLPTCQDQPSASACLLGASATVVYPTATDAPAPSSLYVAVVVAAKPDGALECLGRLGGGQPSGDSCVVALKTLTIQPASVMRNQNPAVTGFLANGNDIHSVPSFKLNQKLMLVPQFQPSVSEVKPDRTNEVLTLSWFATQKDFDHFHSGFSVQPPIENPNNTYTNQSTMSGHVRFWLVLRDDRGGVDWTDGAADFTM